MPTESKSEAARRREIQEMSYTDYLSNTELVKKNVRAIMKEAKNPSIAETVTIDTVKTVKQAFNDAETHLIDVLILVENIKKDIYSNLISNEHLEEQLHDTTNRTLELQENIKNKILAKEKVNRRMINFYNKDSELKKDIIYYLKMLYVFFVAGLAAVVIYKKEHKNKKMWGFIGLLFLLPFYGIHKIYIFFIETIGHFKLDILYISLLIVILAIVFGLFKLGEFSLKKSTENIIDNILNK